VAVHKLTHPSGPR